MESIKLLVLEELWRKDPESRVFLRLAEELRKEGQYERAIEVCKAGLPNHAGYVPAMVSLGRSTQAVGQNATAEEVFEQVLQLAPDNTHALRGLGHLLAERGAHAEALNHLETLLIHEPNDDEVNQKIAWLRQQLHTPPVLPPAPEESIQEQDLSDEAQELDDSLADLDREFEKAMDYTQEDPDLFLDSDSLTGEFEGMPAVVAEQTKQGISESDLENRITRGLKHEKMEHLEEAARIYSELLERFPEDLLVKEHLERVQHTTMNETRRAKKIRLLSNWLDKIKEVYHVS